MYALKLAGALALATAALAPTAADAQHWGPGWHGYHGHHWRGRGWGGPAYYGYRGPHYGYYGWHGGYYRNCGYRWGPYGHRRFWRCY